MKVLDVNAEPKFDDEDDFGEVESRPLIGWLLMAVALVAMAFLIGVGPNASAHALDTAVVVPVGVAAAATGEAGLAFGG